MPQTTIQRGNTLYDWVIAPTTLTWSGSVATVSAAELTATVQGLQVGDVIAGANYNPPAGTTVISGIPYGFTPSNIRVVSANTIGMTWNNTTAGSLTPPTQYWVFEVMRPESPSNLPNSAG